MNLDLSRRHRVNEVRVSESSRSIRMKINLDSMQEAEQPEATTLSKELLILRGARARSCV